MNVYQINKEMLDLHIILEQNNGEVTQGLQDALHKICIARDEKLAALAYLLKYADGQDTLINVELKRLTELKKSVAVKVERLKGLVAELLPKGETWSDALNKFSYRTSHAVEVDEGIELPETYYRTKITTEVDKQKLTTDIKGGAVIPGAKMITRFNVILK